MVQIWQVDEGLPESSGTAMVQTPDGYLWFGTFGGLVRFDGVAFHVLTPDNTPGLPSLAIANLYLDRRSRLWISTDRGLVVRDGERWIDLTHDPLLGDDLVRSFTERADGELLLTTFHGQVLQASGLRIAALPPPPGDFHNAYWGAVDEAGRWWVAQDRFVGWWDQSRWCPAVEASELRDVVNSTVCAAPARDGGLWVLLGTQVHKWSRGVEVSRRPVAEVPGGVWNLYEDSDGYLWIATIYTGLYQVSPAGVTRRFDGFGGDACRAFRFVFEDDEHNRWVGTNGRGLVRLTARRFTSFGAGSGLSVRATSVAPAPAGGVWVGTFGQGLFRASETGLAPAAVPDFTGADHFIQSVLTDKWGRTWIGTYEYGLFVFDDRSGHFVPEIGAAKSNVVALFQDSGGRVWISGGKQVVVSDGVNARVLGAEQGLPADQVVCFGEDQEGTLWLSNLSGVFRYENERFVEVHNADGTSLRGITCMHCAQNGTIWFGSLRTGLGRWHAGAYERVEPDLGLPERVLGILEDKSGYFWLSTDLGVVRIAREELERGAEPSRVDPAWQLFDATDGLPTRECTGLRQPVSACDARGRIWFATMKGVGMIDPGEVNIHVRPPCVNLEKLVYRTTGNRATRGGSASHSLPAPFPARLELPPGTRGVEIYYAAPCFSAPARVRFQLQLDPLDRGWQDVGNRRVAYYRDLEPGQYRFRVRACNADGVWNDVGTSVQFSILPLFWEAGWFHALAVAFVCAVVLLWVYRLRERYRLQRAAQVAFTRQLIARQEAERSRVASELHDSLGHNLLLIQSRLARLADGEQPVAQTGGLVDEVAADVTRALAEVRSISHALRPSALAQAGLTHTITWMIEELGAATGIEFATDLDNIDGLLVPEMEINLYRIMQEGLSNVVKHAGATHVVVSVQRLPSDIVVRIEDNGCGFDARQVQGAARPHFGLTGLAERANLLRGRVAIESAPGSGTRLTVTVPWSGRSQ